MPVLGVMDERAPQCLNLSYEIWVKGRDLHMDLFIYLFNLLGLFVTWIFMFS